MSINEAMKQKGRATDAIPPTKAALVLRIKELYFK